MIGRVTDPQPPAYFELALTGRWDGVRAVATGIPASLTPAQRAALEALAGRGDAVWNDPDRGLVSDRVRMEDLRAAGMTLVGALVWWNLTPGRPSVEALLAQPHPLATALAGAWLDATTDRPTPTTGRNHDR